MARTIIVDGGEKIACPKCNHGFPLSEGISRQTIERYAEDFERSVAAHRRKLEAELAAEAKAQFDSQRKAMNEALGAKEGALARFRSEELQLRRHLRELEEADKNRDVDYQRRLDEERRRIESQFKAQIESAQREADVWIGPFDARRPLPEALRAMLLELHKARQANLGRAEKMELVYNYICSPQFTQRVKSVVDGFAAMRQDLEAEKMAVARMFKKRESQLTRMSDGLLGVVGDLQGIGIPVGHRYRRVTRA